MIKDGYVYAIDNTPSAEQSIHILKNAVSKNDRVRNEQDECRYVALEKLEKLEKRRKPNHALLLLLRRW